MWQDRASQTGQHKSQATLMTTLTGEWSQSGRSEPHSQASVSPGSVGRLAPPPPICPPTPGPSAPPSKAVCDPVMTYDPFNGSHEPHLSFPTIPLPFPFPFRRGMEGMGGRVGVSLKLQERTVEAPSKVRLKPLQNPALLCSLFQVFY